MAQDKRNQQQNEDRNQQGQPSNQDQADTRQGRGQQNRDSQQNQGDGSNRSSRTISRTTAKTWTRVIAKPATTRPTAAINGTSKTRSGRLSASRIHSPAAKRKLAFGDALRKHRRGSLGFMPARSKPYRQFARQALVKTASSATPTQTDLADAFGTLRDRFMRTLVPVFGPVAIEALFERSLHLAVDEFAWLADSLSAARTRVPDVSGIPDAATAENVLDAFTAVIAYDIGLLVALVGEDLILPLVQKAWGPVGRLPTSGESD